MTSEPLEIFKRHRIFFLALLGISALVRWVIVLRGGQLYFPDEGHYSWSLDLVSSAARGDLIAWIDLLLQSPAHPGYVLWGMLPGALQYAVELLFGQPATNTIWIPSILISCMSIWAIALVAAIAKQAGASDQEAMIAALLMACSTSMFYFARHLAPYDLALTIALLALWFGLDQRKSFLRSLVCGVLIGLAFLTYYGYWLISVAVAIVHTLHHKPRFLDFLKRSIAIAIGFILLPLLLTLISLLQGAPPFVLEMAHFATSVSQGTFSEGAWLPWEYLWHAEHGSLIVWMASVAGMAWLKFKYPAVELSRGLLWMGIALFIYLALVSGSVGLGIFVVYGRLVRQLVPFFCLTAGFSIAFIANRLMERRRVFVWVGVIFLIIQTAFNFNQPLTQQFPLEFERQVIANYSSIGRALTVKGPPVFGDVPGKTFRYVLVNAQYLYPISGTRKLPIGQSVLKTWHPLAFLPYQYEGLDDGGARFCNLLISRCNSSTNRNRK